jgi:hypothetical protein
MASVQRLRETEHMTELRVALSGGEAELGRVPAADVARMILLVQQATARAASVVLGRPKLTTGRYEDVVEKAARFVLRSVEAGSVVSVLELPEPDLSRDGALDLEVASLSETAVAVLLDALDEVKPHQVVARALLDLADGMHLGDRYDAVVLDAVGASPRRHRTARLDGAARMRLRAFVESGSIGPTRADALTGVLVEADFEKHTARLRTPTEPGVQVEFTEDLSDDIQLALRQPATLRGEVVYDVNTHIARSVSLSVVERGEQLVLGVDPEAFWLARSFEELAQEQGSGHPIDPNDLYDEDATDEERDKLMAAIAELARPWVSSKWATFARAEATGRAAS